MFSQDPARYPQIFPRSWTLGGLRSTIEPVPTPILATKLYVPPPRANLVLRPRLIERLNEGPSMQPDPHRCPSRIREVDAAQRLDRPARTPGSEASRRLALPRRGR